MSESFANTYYKAKGILPVAEALPEDEAIKRMRKKA